MSAFILICNPKEVWDFREFFAGMPSNGYWCVSKKDFKVGKTGDRLYLKVTTMDKQTGIHARFVLRSRYKGRVPSDHWNAARVPEAPAEQFLFDVTEQSLLKPFLSLSTLKAVFRDTSKLIKTPQAMSSQIENDEADELDKLIGL